MTRPGTYVRATADPVVVERLLAGHWTPYREVDGREVIRRMAELGYHDGQIAYVLRRRRDSVRRTRSDMGVPPALDGSRGQNIGMREAPTRPRSAK